MVKPLAKILLVNPVTESGQRVLRAERCQQKLSAPVGIWPPVTLLEASAWLKQRGFREVEILDAEAGNLDFNALVSEAAKRLPDMVVVQATTPTIEDDILFSRKLKSQLRGTAVVFIGLHATVFPEQILSSDSVDYAVMGEPEMTLAELAGHCFMEKVNIKSIRGLAYKDGGKVFVNQRRPPRDDYDYPFPPDRSLVGDNAYIMPLTGKPFAAVKVSRGCNFSCSFCTSSVYYGKGWKARSPENIVEEVKDAIGKYGIRDFLFLSDTFNADSGFVRRLCSLIIEEELHIRWVANSRIDLIDEETVNLMKKSGCLLVSLGLESFDGGILKKNNKELDVNLIGRGLRILKKYKILTYGYFIFGLEGESKLSMAKTAVRAMLSKLDFAVFYTLTPYPGTPYFERFSHFGWKDYFHGTSSIAGSRRLGKRVIKAAAYASQVLFYLSPRRLLLLARYLLRGKLC